MPEARYEQVPLSTGKTVQVRVITLHPQDDEIKRLQECIARIQGYCASQQCALQGIPVDVPAKGQPDQPPVLSSLSADQVIKTIDTLAELRKRSDVHRRELLKLLLTGKMGEDDAKEVIEQCNRNDHDLIMLAATEPHLLPGVLKRLSSKPPAESPTSAEHPAVSS
jgi:hypothetical protein